MFKYENSLKNKGYDFIIGIDEAGRGPLAGPVVASAVVIHNKKFSNKISDSKKMSSQQREIAYEEISEKAYVGVGIIDHNIIDSINILNATFLAMNNAIKDLILKIPNKIEKKIVEDNVILLIDGDRFKPAFPYQYQTIVDGDEKIISISCASIIAKVTRDRIMDVYDRAFPQYGFKKHKGYATEEHRKTLIMLGPTDIHRKSFRYKYK